MHAMYCTLLLLALVATATATAPKAGLVVPTVRQADDTVENTCDTREDETTFTLGGCPNICTPLNQETFDACNALASSGCEMQPCPTDREMIVCTLSNSVLETAVDEIEVCPGDTIVFDNVPVSQLQDIRVRVNLQSSPLRTDFYLLSDATGSISTAIASVQSGFQEIIDEFATQPDVAFGVGIYRDEEELDNGFRNLQSLTTMTGPVRNAVDSISAFGGLDRDEANLVALFQVATDPSIGWRDNSRRILVYFGDNPGHEPSCNDGLPQIDRFVVRDALQAQNITIIGVSFPPGPGLNRRPRQFNCGVRGRAPRGQANFLARATDGTIVRSVNQADVIPAITTALAGLSRTFDVDESDCVDNLESSHEPSLPISLPPNALASVVNTISVREGVCDLPSASFECSFRYFESGAAIGVASMQFLNIQGCGDSM